MGGDTIEVRGRYGLTRMRDLRVVRHPFYILNPQTNHFSIKNLKFLLLFIVALNIVFIVAKQFLLLNIVDN